MKASFLHQELDLTNCSSIILDCQNVDKPKIIVEKGTHKYVLTTNFHSGCEMEIMIEEDGILHLSFLASENIDNSKITANLQNNAQLSAYFADFSLDKEKIDIVINLRGDNALAYWHLASLAANKDQKEFDVSIYHFGRNTSAISNNYGVCKDSSKLIFSGCSSINKGSHGSKTRQNAKIMVFDQNCDAIARPLLKIDEKDIEASHGAVVGKIPDEHLFYLTSRGLNEFEAKKLITFGYLKPIIRGFKEKDMQDQIINLIERRM
ncbi:MAG: SufD family Fe-S cluster assembly protein [Bacilli bacterium]